MTSLGSAIVTGGASGIGAATVRALADPVVAEQTLDGATRSGPHLPPRPNRAPRR